jgi:2-polyprenyl-6-methoxyphenol hydroxylase-like FAD-dependent oxidoreductase
MDSHYDLVIAGGSIAGAALGCAAQRNGARVLVVEPEREFRDRVRGESLHPWGVAELHRLGLRSALEDAPAWTARYWDTHVGGQRVDRRDLIETTPSGCAGANVHHPEFQSTLLSAAEAAGTCVRRGTRVVRIAPGAPTSLELAQGDACSRVTARLAVIADGRSSRLRHSLGISATGALSPLCVAGVLLEGLGCTEPGIEMFMPTGFGALALIVPLVRARARLYYVYRRDAQTRGYTGPADLGPLLERCAWAGVPAAWLAQPRALGPLATFDTTCASVNPDAIPHGVALVGDAAGTVDPTFGCGMSLALRDARCLSEHLAEGDDWQLAAAHYARERSRYHAALLRIEAWLQRILFTTGAAADALRAVAMPRLAALGVDIVGIGPDGASDGETERQLFAADEA